jgi:hypothetical protein
LASLLIQVAFSMPTLVTPEAPPSLPETPACAHCGRMMRLQGSSSSQHCDKLEQFRYVCDCGWAMDKVMAHSI